MNIEIDAKTKLKLSKISNELTKKMAMRINNIANSIVKDHSNRLSFGQGVDGKMMKALKPETIKTKRESGYKKPRIPLYATGTMKGVKIVQRATKSKPIAVIMPKDNRKEIGKYHQSGGGTLPKREWFGITANQEKKGLKIMRLEIERLLKNG